MSFVVEQKVFSGPLALLLDLLDSKELEIKDVSLGAIADEYLNYLQVQSVPSDELADFLLIASRLIYIKTRELVPYLRSPEEEEQVENLEEQLRLYRLFSSAADSLQELYRSKQYGHTRPYRKKVNTQVSEPVFSMPPHLTTEDLKKSFYLLLKKLEPFFALQQTSIERVKSVKGRIEEMKGAITSRSKMAFNDVIRNAEGKADIVVSFLALLELVRQQIVVATQLEEDDIIIKRI